MYALLETTSCLMNAIPLCNVSNCQSPYKCIFLMGIREFLIKANKTDAEIVKQMSGSDSNDQS